MAIHALVTMTEVVTELEPENGPTRRHELEREHTLVFLDLDRLAELYQRARALDAGELELEAVHA